MNPRYEGKPFLRLLECYILWAIDALSDADRKQLESMEVKLRQTYRRNGTWYEIVAAEMGFPVGRPESITRTWRDNKERAERSGQVVQPEDFARFLADYLISSRALEVPPSPN
jgi:hypothetical protein